MVGSRKRPLLIAIQSLLAIFGSGELESWLAKSFSAAAPPAFQSTAWKNVCHQCPYKVAGLSRRDVVRVRSTESMSNALGVILVMKFEPRFAARLSSWEVTASIFCRTF